MMLPSALRRARCRLRRSRLGTSAGVRLPLPSAATGPFVVSNVGGRSIGPRAAITSFGFHRQLPRPAVLLRDARFSTKWRQRNLLINAADELPEIYASPVAFVEENSPHIVPSEGQSVFIVKDGEQEQWHTATYTDTKSKEIFRSGSFGGFLDRIGASNRWDAPNFSEEETRVVEGKVYYRSQHIAKQAAAARVLDCYAFMIKTRLWRDVDENELEPLRYCKELPHALDFSAGPSSSSASVPSYQWACLMEAKYGPSDIQFDVEAMAFEGGEEPWFTAMCFEPKTGEAFASGVFGPDDRFVRSKMPEAPQIPLHLEEIRTCDGRVFYRDETTAKHAAAARAIDCLNYRSINSGDGGKRGTDNRLCMEEPYLIHTDKQNLSPADYEELERIVASRHREIPEFSLSDYVNSTVVAGKRENPRFILQRSLETKHGSPFGDPYTVTSIKDGDSVWFTSIFTDPFSKEEFGSGIIRAQSEEPAPCPPVRVIDGSVYYEKRASFATRAAAARALDCYILREKSPDDAETPVRFCYEEPYRTAEEGQQQEHDYASLLAQQHEDIKSFPDPKPFTAFTEWKAYLLHTPKQLLQGAFTSANGIELRVRQTFDVHTQNINRKCWHTATFTDPVTKEIFPSGLVGKEVDVEKRNSAILDPPLYRTEATVIDGRVYYQESRLAEHAAAARAIDCYIFREGGGEKSDIQLCMEDPYTSMEEGVLQTIDYDALLAEKGLLSAKKRCKDAPNPRVSSSTFTAFADSKAYLLHSPKALLQTAFTGANGIELRRQAFDVHTQNINGNYWNTATFTDPVTKEIFPSGLVGKEVNVEKRPSHLMKLPLHRTEATVIDGRVYYPLTNLAEHAAAARAIDCYIFREGGGTKSDIQLCMEDPYNSMEEGAAQTIDYDALLAQRNIPSASKNCSPVRLDSVEVDAAAKSFHDEIPALELASNKIHARVDSPLSTMGRITEIWLDAASGGLDSSDVQPYSEHENANQSPIAKITGILAWYDELDKEPRNYADARGLAQLCNKILASLGDAVCGLDLEEPENHVDVEGDAKVILESILSLSSTFDDKNDPSFFDAGTFNAYMRCLDRLNPARSAKAATDLLKSMANQEQFEGGANLPLPNVATYNSAMSLWALVDCSEGQRGVNNVFSLLETASRGSDGEGGLFPNKETFNILLAANSKVDGRFSFEQAKLWLGKIQEISESICGEAFVPDADFYNAALTSFSKTTETNSTTERYGNTWLRHGHPYASGFKSADERTSDIAEAANIAEWLIHAEQSGTTPSVEMYEAVIQAWVKTGVLKEGLLTAETWATRAVQSGSPIRLQTFHPIIAAWAMCQLDRAPERVAEWTQQLASQTALEPDLTTLSAQVIAWRNVQAGMMAKAEVNKQQWSDDYDMQRDVERAFATAQNCTQYLKEVFAEGSVELKGQQDAAALTSIFTNAIETWGCASRFTLRCPSSPVLLDAKHGVNEMLKVARLFDATIDNKIESVEKAQCHLHVMGESYAAVMSQLHQLDSAVASATESNVARCYFLEKIPRVEQMMRNYELFSHKHFSPGNFAPESKATRHRMYREALRGCAGVNSPTDFGHVSRIIRLIMEQLAWQNEHCPGGGGRAEADVTDLYVEMALLTQTIAQVPEERMYVLTKVHDSASQFFEKKRKSEGSAYATVDRARLIGAMRMAMGDAPFTEEFVQRFDGGPKTNARGNTALARVDELLKK